MVKFFIYLFTFFIFIFNRINAQVILQVDAGSRAPWGIYQNLVMDAKGHCTYTRSKVNGPVLESSSFTITTQQMDALFSKADQVKFYQLKEKYDGGYSDGAGIFIALRRDGKNHHVDLRNTDIPEVNQWVALFNDILKPHKIRIYYGQTP